MGEEDICQQFRLTHLEEIKNYFIKEIGQNEVMSKKQKKVSIILNYPELIPFLVSAIAGYVSVSAFVSLLSISIGITSSVLRLKICTVTKKHKSMIKKKEKKA